MLDHQLMQLGEGLDQDLLHQDPAVTAAALNAAVAAAANSGEHQRYLATYHKPNLTYAGSHTFRTHTSCLALRQQSPCVRVQVYHTLVRCRVFAAAHLTHFRAWQQLPLTYSRYGCAVLCCAVVLCCADLWAVLC
jgi:hypothetical protein